MGVECTECGCTEFEREIKIGNTANRTKNNYVGGRDANLSRVCVNCGTEIETVSGSTGRSGPDYNAMNSGADYGPNWDEQREKALQRDLFRCQGCGTSSHDTALVVHHITPRKDFVDDEGKLDYKRANQLENLKTLCKDCHAEVHDFLSCP